MRTINANINTTFTSSSSSCTPQNVVITSIAGGNRITWTQQCPLTQTEIWADIDDAGYVLLNTTAPGIETYDHTGLAGNIVSYKLRSRLVVLNAPLNLSASTITGGIRLTWDDNNTDATHIEIYANIADAGYVLLNTVAVGIETYDHIINLYVETTILYKIRAKETDFYSEYSAVLTRIEPANISEGEVVILAGNTVGWYDPTDTNLIRDIGGGVTDIWWDKIYGKEGALGAVLDSGASEIYAVYRIETTTANFFYAGCQVGDVWACSAVKALSVLNNLRRYTGNHLSNSNANLRPTNHIFDGADDFMKTPAIVLVRPVMMYAVVKQITWTLNDCLFDGFGSTSLKVQQGATTPKFKTNNGVASVENTNMAIDTLVILRISLAIGSGSNQVNNTAATGGASGTNEMNGFTVGMQGGGGIYAHMDVREIVLRDKIDDATDQTKIYNYLATKHGLPTI